MIFSLLFKPFLFGLVAACALGPMMLLILHRVTSQGIWAGIISALGLAFSDGLIFALGMTGGLSLARQSAYLVHSIEKFGGIVLIVMGLQMLARNKVRLEATEKLPSPKQANFLWLFSSIIFLTIINPMTFVFFASASVKIFPELIAHQTSVADVIIRALALSCGSFSALSAVIFAASQIPKMFISRLALLARTLGGIGFVITGFYLLLDLYSKY